MTVQRNDGVVRLADRELESPADKGPGWQTRMLSRPGAVGRYRLLERVGRGSMGEVWLAEDPEIDRPVAIKVLRVPGHLPADRRELWEERALREARAVGRLNHPGIISVYDVGKTTDGRPYIVMEWVDGDSLGHILRTGALPSEEAVLEWGAQIGDSLDSAHKSGIVHRDVKPQNILIDKNHRARILDFGLARFPDSDLTQTGSFLGSPAFSSPEQIRGREMDGRSDLFSLGSVLYTMLTGVQPFRSEDLAGLAYEICHVEAVPPSCYAERVSKQADIAILKALSKDPDRRYQNGHEMAEALRAAAAWDIEEALSSGFVSATPAGTPFSHLWRTSPGSFLRRGSRLLAYRWKQGRVLRLAMLSLPLLALAAASMLAGVVLERNLAKPTAVEAPIAASLGRLSIPPPGSLTGSGAGPDIPDAGPGPDAGPAVVATPTTESTPAPETGKDSGDGSESGSQSANASASPPKPPTPKTAPVPAKDSADTTLSTPADPEAATDLVDPAAVLPEDAPSLVITVRHRLKDGRVTITTGDRVLIEEDLTTSERKVKLFGRYRQGVVEWPVRVAPGEQTIRVRVQSDEKALDITRELRETLGPEGAYELDVVVRSGGSAGVTVEFADAGA